MLPGRRERSDPVFLVCRRFGGSLVNCNLRFRAKPVPEATVFSRQVQIHQRTHRKQLFTNPNFSFITPNTCSTFDRTVDFVRFLARSTSSTQSL